MPTLYLLIAAIVGPILVGVSTYGVEELWRQPKAIAKAVQAEAERCAGKINEIRAQSAEATLSQFEAATQAELGIGPTPVDRAELQVLCNSDAACREHKK